MRLIKMTLGFILAIHLNHSWAEDTQVKSSTDTKATIPQPTPQDDDEIDAAPDNTDLIDAENVENK
ncbi:hypothetical protein [Acinetobacter rongchengensis]|uniref:Uncharacterized protein n=1 Tax=Acinetobacter rongchengensis TaxID=2419601 RepID=A0A3A8F243_9GAMM|nr:hypothetical protein [Acinetobacter rongchengensis]RKG37120.1 hypothetical protein D7V20_12090 [Acinetobacter rongchengensis]